MGITIQLPPRPSAEQSTFNLERWKELRADPELAKLSHRIETDRYGHILMTPPPAPNHGVRQFKVGARLEQYAPGAGHVITECPVSTSDGVKAVDVAWVSAERFALLDAANCFATAPEICVEVLSPSNSGAEMEEKKALYFEAGAMEVWFCDADGAISFFGEDGPLTESKLCKGVPSVLEL